MPLGELLPLLWESIRGHKLRAVLTILGIVIGIGSVVLLSSIGEGTRQAISAMFSQFGTTLVSVIPGKSETMGDAPGSLLGTTRPLTIEDAQVLKRIPGVREISINFAAAGEVEYGEKGRSTYVYGCISSSKDVWRWYPRVGEFIPAGDPYQAPAVCVLGSKVKEELFGKTPAVGKMVRISTAKFRVVGVMQSKGKFLGFDLDDSVYIPVVRAMRLFNRDEVHEINLDVASYQEVDIVIERIKKVLIQRHDDEEDFTVVSQAAMLEVINNVMGIITKGVIAIAAIAIFVGAMGILTITWVSVHERTQEIGLLKAIGASNRQVMMLFLSEAVLLSTLGGLAGITFGILGGEGLSLLVKGLRVNLAEGVIPICIFVSMAVGAVAGWLPARRAAKLDPIQALRDE